jgi:hypothetical protein
MILDLRRSKQRVAFLTAILFCLAGRAHGQESNATKWEFKAVSFQAESEGTKKLNELAADGWTYVGPLTNGLVAFKRPVALPKVDRKIIRIDNYDYELPSWWDSVKVTVPKGLTKEEEVANYVRDRCGKEVGTQQTWKEALKTWALWYEEHNYLPVYIAHCHFTGGDHRRAAEMYADLCGVLDAEPKHEANIAVQCYLSYEAGRSYLVVRDIKSARKWLSRAAQYVGHQNRGIAYYGEEAAQMLKEVDERESKGKDKEPPLPKK